MSDVNNVTYTINGDKLTITMDVSKKTRNEAQFSKTGKSRLVGSTGGFIQLPNELKLSLNVICK